MALGRHLNGIYPAEKARRRKSKNVFQFRDMPGSNLPPVSQPPALSRLTGSSPVAALASSHLFITLFKTMFMTEDNQNTQHTPFPPEKERRTEYVGAKVTPGQKRHIRRLADECGMTVSNYMLARAFGYRPKARLTARQEAVMETLIGCRSDLLNYTSALRGMAPEKRRQMFGSYPFMLGWLKELGRLAERITGVLDRLWTDNRLPDGTRNKEDEEEEP